MPEEIDFNIVPPSQDSATEPSSNVEVAARKLAVSNYAPSWSSFFLIVVLCIGMSFPAAMVIENVQDTFGIPAEYDKYSQPPPHILIPMMAAARSAQRKNAALGLGICGALLGCILGFCVGIETVGSLRSAMLGLLEGIVVAGTAGAIGGVGNALLFRRFTESGIDELYQAMVIHAPAWVLIGMAAGSVACVVNRSWFSAWRLFIAGGGAGLVSAAAFPILSLQAFPDAHPALLFPDKFGSLVLWIGLSYGLITIAVLRTVGRRVDAGRRVNLPTANPQ